MDQDTEIVLADRGVALLRREFTYPHLKPQAPQPVDLSLHVKPTLMLSQIHLHNLEMLIFK
jgi:hypothetical protein